MAINPTDANQASQTPFPPPQNFNDFMQRVFLLLRAFLGSTVIIILLGAVGFIIFIALAILKGS